MNQLTKKDKVIFYEIIRTKKKEYHVTTKEGIAVITAPDYADEKTIKQVLSQQFYYLYYKLHPEEINRTVHYKGKTYNAVCKIGKKNSVVIKDEEIIITSTENKARAHQNLLRSFYKRTIEEELTKLIYEAQHVFKEVPFPKINVLYLTKFYGRYFKIPNKIQISSLMAKYDLKYLKVVLYHELTHTLEITHNERFFRIFEEKCPGGPKEDDEFKLIKINDCM